MIRSHPEQTVPSCSPLLLSVPCCLWPVDKPVNSGASSLGRMERNQVLTPTVAFDSTFEKCQNKGGRNFICSSDEVFSTLISALKLSHILDKKAFSALWWGCGRSPSVVLCGHVTESSAVCLNYIRWIDAWQGKARLQNALLIQETQLLLLQLYCV